MGLAKSRPVPKGQGAPKLRLRKLAAELAGAPAASACGVGSFCPMPAPVGCIPKPERWIRVRHHLVAFARRINWKAAARFAAPAAVLARPLRVPKGQPLRKPCVPGRGPVRPSGYRFLSGDGVVHARRRIATICSDRCQHRDPLLSAPARCFTLPTSPLTVRLLFEPRTLRDRSARNRFRRSVPTNRS